MPIYGVPDGCVRAATVQPPKCASTGRMLLSCVRLTSLWAITRIISGILVRSAADRSRWARGWSMRSTGFRGSRAGQTLTEFALLLVLVLSALAIILLNFRSHVQHLYGGTADAVAHVDCSTGGSCPTITAGTGTGTSGGGSVGGDGGTSGGGPTWNGSGAPPT